MRIIQLRPGECSGPAPVLYIHFPPRHPPQLTEIKTDVQGSGANNPSYRG